MKPRVKTGLALAAAFILGGIFGGFGVRATQLDQVNQLMTGPTPAARRNFMLEVLNRRLELTQDQSQKIRELFEEHEPARRQAMEPCKGAAEAARAQLTANIDALLTEEQRKRHAELRAELEAKRKSEQPPTHTPH